MPSKDRETTFIGKVNFRGKQDVFGIKAKDRRQHMYVIGKTGTGKTTLLENMILQDIRAGRGVGLIDPHGEFVERVLDQIPSSRLDDVVYFNPVDMDYPIGFNVLEVPDLRYKHLVVSDLLGIFTKIWANVWSARMEYILQNCIMALLDTPGTTLLGIPRILVDKEYRERIVGSVKDPVVRSFWVHEYDAWQDKFRNEAIVPIQNKVGQFLNTSFVRNILGQPKSTLNIPEIMNAGKILLVNVSKGKVGEDNSALLGAMIITKVQLAAMERVRIEEEERKDFYLYVDEFQNFATDSFANILSEARKYRLDLIIAHQYVGQLVTDISTKVRDAVFGNVGTMISFRVGAADAEFLEKEFMPEFVQQDLINLPNHHVYLKLMVDGLTSRPFSSLTLPPLTFETDPEIRANVIQRSRDRYSNPREEVETRISRWSQMGEAGNEDIVVARKYDAICANCGKNTTVPFKPDGKRPVYCQQCLKQIEEGRLIPLPDRMPQTRPARFSESLQELGIEFGVSPPAPRPQAPVSRSRRDSLRPAPDRASLQPPAIRPRSFTAREDSFREPRRPREREVSGAMTRTFRSQPAVRVPQGVKPLSLSELADRESAAASRGAAGSRRTSPRPQVDIAGLRQALEHFLNAPPGGSKQKAEAPPRKNEKNTRAVMEPGETVKL